MSGNTIGQLFCVTTCGESHGSAYGCIIDGCPPGMALSESDIQSDLDRRKPGRSRYTSQRRETDRVRIVSGVFEGVTTGTPIGLFIENHDSRSKDYKNIQNKLRPGHADYTYLRKYGLRDYRGGGRASARETMMRVAAGAVAKKYLAEHCAIRIRGCLSQVGELNWLDRQDEFDWQTVEQNMFFCPIPEKIPQLENLINTLRQEGDSIGSALLVMAEGVPPGLGEPVFARLDADIAQAMMGINAVKGVEIGAGFAAVAQRGSKHRDEMSAQGFYSNHAGGVLGGISSGQDIVVRVAFKAASSIRIPGRSIDTDYRPTEVVTLGRHDPCVGLRAVPIVEAMLAIVLTDHLLRHRAQNYAVTHEHPPLPASRHRK